MDLWLLHSGILDEVSNPLVVDVGIGAKPDTTVELHRALDGAEVVGTDIDPERVAWAQGHAAPGLRFVQAGFELGLERPACVIRAMNVLRQYKPDQVALAHQSLGRSLGLGGVLLDGTCSPDGDVLGCLVLRASPEGLRREALILAVSGARGFAPLMLRDRLPRDIRDKGNPGHPVGDFLNRWTGAWLAVRGSTDPSRDFARSAQELSRRGEAVQTDLAEQGLLVWQPPDGVAGR